MRANTCLETEYLGEDIKHRFRCAENHEWTAKTYSLLNDHWCPTCAREKFRLPISAIQDYATAHGFRCLSTSYDNRKSRLEWECPNGHRWSATYPYMRQRPGCHKCRVEERQQHVLEKCHQIARLHGGQCLSTNYRGCNAKMQWRCAEGHEWASSYQRIHSGAWCPVCARVKGPQLALTVLSEMRDLAKTLGGWCLSHRYRRKKIPLLWECKYGHRFEMARYKVQTGHWCPVCEAEAAAWKAHKIQAREVPRNAGRLATAQFYAQYHGGACLSTQWRGTRHHMSWECEFGHRWVSQFRNIQEGIWCPVCGEEKRATTLDRSRGMVRVDDLEEAEYWAEQIGCTWVGGLVSRSGRTHWYTCGAGHIWETEQAGDFAGSWCPECGVRGTPLYKGRVLGR